MSKYLKTQNEKCRKAYNRQCVVSYVLAGVVFALLLVLICGCSPKIIQNTVEKEKIVYRDSTVYRDTTLYIPIPLEKDQAIVHVGDTSRRETSIARSEAWVDTTGFLHHKLENKAGNFRVVVYIPSHYIQNEITKEKAEYLTKIEYREKPLSWWKSFKIKAFWWLLGSVIALLIWIFRKPLLKLLAL